jgi:tetraacyldisaccharide 4'-kinase
MPPDLGIEEQAKLERTIDQYQQLYLEFVFRDFVFRMSSIDVKLVMKQPEVLVAGIARSDPFQLLKTRGDICLSFPDHHDFSL